MSPRQTFLRTRRRRAHHNDNNNSNNNNSNSNDNNNNNNNNNSRDSSVVDEDPTAAARRAQRHHDMLQLLSDPTTLLTASLQVGGELSPALLRSLRWDASRYVAAQAHLVRAGIVWVDDVPEAEEQTLVKMLREHHPAKLEEVPSLLKEYQVILTLNPKP